LIDIYEYVKCVFILPFILFLTSCGLHHKPSPTEKWWLKKGIDPLHFKSCGPVGLQKVYSHFIDENVTNIMISIEIQENRKIKIFKMLGTFDVDFRSITCPPELLSHLKRNNFKYESITYNELKEGDVAIVLLKGHDDFYDWHWAIYPDDRNEIPTFFKDYTKIIKTYKITRANLTLNNN